MYVYYMYVGFFFKFFNHYNFVLKLHAIKWTISYVQYVNVVTQYAFFSLVFHQSYDSL